MRISVWSSDVCSSDLPGFGQFADAGRQPGRQPGLVRDQRAVVDTQRSQGKARLRPRFFLELAVLGGMDGRPYATVSCRSAQREFSRQRVSSADCHGATRPATRARTGRSEEHTSELQSLMRTSYAVFCLKKKN